MSNGQQFIMCTVSGKDRPGITAAFSRVLLEHGVEIVDIEQASLQNLLGLYFLLDLGQSGPGKDSVIKDLLFEASKLGLRLVFSLYAPHQVKRVSQRNLYILSFFGGTPAVAALSSVLGEEGVNIEMISTVDYRHAKSVEMTLNVGDAPGTGGLKKKLMHTSRQLGVDMALQRMEAYRKSKRLIVFDMDSTLLDMEVIDEMAAAAGVGREVARITEKALRGEFDFKDSLTQRVALMKGLSLEKMKHIRENLKLSPGVEDLVHTLKWLGYKLGVITGGFGFFAQQLQSSLGLDFAHANRLEIKDGVLSGKVLGDIVDEVTKARIFNDVACDLGIHLDQSVAVGDGANDALMLGQAGLGIAYNAKKALEDTAAVSLGHSRLENILHLLGITHQDMEAARQKCG